MNTKTHSCKARHSACLRAMTALYCFVFIVSGMAPAYAQAVANTAPAGTPTSMPNSTHKSNLDLSSTTTTNTAARALTSNKAQSVTINVGGVNQTVTGTTQLTQAERMAVMQVLRTGSQSIQLGAQGNAVGGTFTINSRMAQHLNNLVIPQGVTAIDKLTTTSTLNLAGNLTNAGNLYVVSNNPAFTTATINAINIANQKGALISTMLPAGLLSGYSNLVPNLSLQLNAINNIVNAGIIKSAGNLGLTAGGSIINALPTGVTGPNPVLQAMNHVNLNAANIVNQGVIASQVGNINATMASLQNAGLMNAVRGNITLNAPISQNLNINNTGGVLQALNGAMNLRDASYNGTNNTYVSGGSLLSQGLNINSGNGTSYVKVGELTGNVTATGYGVHISSSAKTLRLGNINVVDPTFYNDAGGIAISDDITAAESIAIVASGDIVQNNSGLVTISSTGTGSNGNITLVAGANIDTSSCSGCSPSTDLPTVDAHPIPAGQSIAVTGGSATGGNIVNNNGLRLESLHGSNVTAVAFDGSSPSTKGTVVLDSIASGGDVTVIAGGNAISGTTAIQLGAVTAGATGTVTLSASQPTVTSNVVFDSTGAITSGSFASTTSGTGGISIVGAMSADVVQMTTYGAAHGNIALGANVTGTTSVALTSAAAITQSGGTIYSPSISLTAGGNIGGTSSSAAIAIAIASVSGGTGTLNLTAVAGANAFVSDASGDSIVINGVSSAGSGDFGLTNTATGGTITVSAGLTVSNGEISLESDGLFSSASGGSINGKYVYLTSNSGSIALADSVTGTSSITLTANSGSIYGASSSTSARTQTAYLTASASGNILLTNTGAVHLIANSTGGDVTITNAGSVTLETSSAGSGKTFSLTTSASGSILVDVSTVTAQNVELIAGGTGTVSGQGDIYATSFTITTPGTSLFSLTSTSDTFFSLSSGDQLFVPTTAPSPTSVFSVTAGCISVTENIGSSAHPYGTVNLTAAGDVTGTDPTYTIYANMLRLSSAGGGNIGTSGTVPVPLSTAVSSLSLAGNIANAWISNTGDLTLTSTPNVQTDFELTNTGSLSVTGSVSGYSVYLTTGNNFTASLGSNIQATYLRIKSNTGSLTLTDSVSGNVVNLISFDSIVDVSSVTATSSLRLESIGGNIGTNAGDPLQTAVTNLFLSATSANPRKGNAWVSNTGDLTLSSASVSDTLEVTGSGKIALVGAVTSTGGGTVSLTAGTDITQTAGTVSASTINLTATAGSIGTSGSPLSVSVVNLIANAQGDSQNVYIAASGACNVSGASQAGNGTGGWGTFSLSTAAAGDLTSFAGIQGGLVVLSSAGKFALGGAVTGSTSVTLQAAGDIANGDFGTITTPLLNLTSTGGNIGPSGSPLGVAVANLTANAPSGSVNIFDTYSDIGSNTVTIGLSSANTTTGVFTVEAHSAAVLTNSGAISANTVNLIASAIGGAIRLGADVTGTTSGTVGLTSDGSIESTGGHVIAGTLNLTSYSGNIGTSQSSPLITEVSSLSLSAASGNAWVSNTGDLTITGATVSNTPSKQLQVTNAGDVIVSGAVSGYSISLTASAHDSSLGDIAVSAAVGDSSTNDVTLQAAHNVTSFASGTITANSTASITATGGAINLGDVVSADTVDLTSQASITTVFGITATTLNLLTTGGNIGADIGDPLVTTVSNLSVSASASAAGQGNAWVSNTGDLALASASVNKDLSVNNTGNLTVSGAVTGKSITLAAIVAPGSDGDIAVNAAIGDSGTNNVTLDAQHSVGGNSAGNITATAITSITASGGAISLAGSISVPSGTVNLTSNDNIVNASVAGGITAATLNLNSTAGSIGGSGSGTDPVTGNFNTTVSNLSLLAADSALVSNTGVLTITGASVGPLPGSQLQLTNAGNLTVSGAVTGNSLSLTATAATGSDGDILVNAPMGDSNTNEVTLQAAHDVTTITGATITATSIASFIATGGAISLGDVAWADTVNLTSSESIMTVSNVLAGTLNLVSTAGNIGTDIGHPLSTTVSNLSVTANASAAGEGNAWISNTGDMILTGASVNKVLAIAIAGNLTVSGAVAGDTLSLSASATTIPVSDGSIVVDAAIGDSVHTHSITLQADNNVITNLGGTIAAVTSASITATGGAISLGDAVSAGTVHLTSNASITDVSNITATTLNLESTGGNIGTDHATPLATTASNLSLVANSSAAGQGNAWVSNTGSLTLTSAAVNKVLEIANAGNLTVSGAVTGDTLSFTATATTTPVTEGNIIVNGAVGDSTNTHFVTLLADNDVTTGVGGTIAAAINVSITATGGAINLGDAVSAGTVSLTSNASITDMLNIIATTLSLESTGGNIGSDHASPLFTTASNLSLVASSSAAGQGNAWVSNTGSLMLTSAAVNKVLEITTAGNLTVSGAVTGDSLSFTAKATTIPVTEGNIIVNDAVGDSTNTHFVTLLADNNVTTGVGGTIAAATTASITATGGAISLGAGVSAGTVNLTSNASITDVLNITATTLNLISTGGNIGTDHATPLATTASNLSLVANSSAAGQGNAWVSNTGSLTLTSAAVNKVLEIANAGNLTVSGAVTGDTLSFTATATTTPVTDGNIIVNGAVGDSINTHFVTLLADKDITSGVGGTIAAATNVSITATGGAISLGAGVSAGTVNLTSNASITDVLNITATTLNLISTAGSIGTSGSPLRVTVTDLTANAQGDSQNVYIAASGTCNISGASQAGNGTGGWGTFSLTSNGALTNSGGAIIAGTVNLTSSTAGVTLSNTVTGAGTSGAVNVVSASDITDVGLGTGYIGASNISLQSTGGSITLSSGLLASGSISLTASGAVTATTVGVTAPILTVIAGTDANVKDISSAAVTLNASSAGDGNTFTLEVPNAALDIAGALKGVGSAVIGTVNLTSNGALTNSGGAITAGTVNLTSNSAGVILSNLVTGAGTSGAVNVVSFSDITDVGLGTGYIGASNISLQSTGGSITLSSGLLASGSISLTASGAVTATAVGVTAPVLTVVAGTDANVKDISLAAVTLNASSAGDGNTFTLVVPNAALDIAGALKGVGSAVIGTVNLTSKGSLTTSGGAITAGTVNLTSISGSIGTSAGSPLMTTVGSMLLSAVAGNAWVTNTGDLTLTSAVVQSALDLTTVGNLTVTGVVSGGTIGLTANAGGGSLGDILLNAGGVVNGTTSATLTAANNFTTSGVGNTISADVVGLTATGGTISLGDSVTGTNNGSVSLRSWGSILDVSKVTASRLSLVSTNGTIGTSSLSPLSTYVSAIDTIYAPSGSAWINNDRALTLGFTSVVNALEVTAAGNITVTDQVFGDTVVLTANAGITVGNILVNASGYLTGTTSVTLLAANNVTTAGTGNTISAPTVSLTATAGAISLGDVVTGTSSGTVNMTSLASITNVAKVTAGTLNLSSTGGDIGTASVALVTVVGTISLSAAGNAWVDNTGDLTLTAGGVLTQLSLITAGDLSVTGLVSGDSVALTANAGGGSQGNIVLSGSGAVTGTTSAILLAAHDVTTALAGNTIGATYVRLTATGGAISLGDAVTGSTVSLISQDSITDVSEVTANTLNLTSTAGDLGTSTTALSSTVGAMSLSAAAGNAWVDNTIAMTLMSATVGSVLRMSQL